MNKVYEKPELAVVEFELNEAIASCSVKLFNFRYNDCKNDPTENGRFYQNLGNNFVEDDTSCGNPVVGYCYHTAAGMMLMNS